MKRYAVYYAPKAGAFAEAAAAWLGWDAQKGCAVGQPAVALPRSLANITAEPRKYGFHGTLKPPFRLADGVSFDDLSNAVASVAARLHPLVMAGLEMVNLQGFLALVPQGDLAPLQALAAEVVGLLEPCRAALSPPEIARRKPDSLTVRQRELLAIYGYPYVMEQFRFHLTLTGTLADAELAAVTRAALAHIKAVLPRPFRLDDLCLFGEDDRGQFHLLHRYSLSA
ncbi:MAG: hypothetical protein JWS10_2521 [Cypionkella sp.]|nr:hypothetical protein [Cypionkella sp.]